MKHLYLTEIGIAFAVCLSAQGAAQSTNSGNTRPLPPDNMARGRNFDQQLQTRMGLDPKAIYKTPDAVAGCLVKLNGKSAGQLIGGTETRDPGFKALQLALSGKQNICAPTGAMPMDDISGALAEQLVKLEPAPSADRGVATDSPAADAYSKAPATGLTMATVGRCLASHSPGSAYRLLTHPSRSAGERSALTALYASTPECKLAAPPEGFSLEEQRIAIATGLYFWTHRR